MKILLIASVVVHQWLRSTVIAPLDIECKNNKAKKKYIVVDVSLACPERSKSNVGPASILTLILGGGVGGDNMSCIQTPSLRSPAWPFSRSNPQPLPTSQPKESLMNGRCSRCVSCQATQPEVRDTEPPRHWRGAYLSWPTPLLLQGPHTLYERQ